jgi:hypothetical protein
MPVRIEGESARCRPRRGPLAYPSPPIADSHIGRIPNESDLPDRLRAVLAVVYLIFNEG